MKEVEAKMAEEIATKKAAEAETARVAADKLKQQRK